MLKLTKEAAQLVFNEISIPRGPSDRISAVIQMCLRAGAVTPGTKPPPEPVVLSEIGLSGDRLRAMRNRPEPEPEEVEDNASGEGAVTVDDD